jgi:hypothetical protein
MKAELRLVLDRKQVGSLIGQDPMGDLEKPVTVKINGIEFDFEVQSFVCADGQDAIVDLVSHWD